MTTHIDRILLLPDAAARMGISVGALTRLISNGKMKAVRLPDGSLAVSERDTNEDIAKEQFEHLGGRPITIASAVRKYDVPRPTLQVWVKRNYIHVIKSGYRMELDEQDVAYCAAVYHKRKEELGSLVGTRLFDEDGRPYQLEYPDVARYRRRKRSAKE